MTMDLIQQDKAQRQLALDAKQSFIVQAPAGSGKTELLIQRFLVLLNTVNSPEEILAITFTKKAANEMRARIIKALKQAENEPMPESEHGRQTWQLATNVLKKDKELNWHLLNNPNQLRIQTIDALSTYLTKQLPLLSHFGSQPSIAPYPHYLYQRTVQEILQHVEENYEWSEAIAHLLMHLDNDLNKLHDLIINLLAKRDQWLPYIHLDLNDLEIREQLEYQLKLIIEDELIRIVDLVPTNIVADLLAAARYAAENLIQNEVESDITACRDLTQLPNHFAKNKKIWLGFAKLLLTNDGEWRKSCDVRIGFPAASSFKTSAEKLLAAENKQKILAVIKVLNDHENLRLALKELAHLPDPAYQDAQWETLRSLLQVLKIVAAQLRLTFQQTGEIDFIENSQAALFALGNDEHPTDLALALDYQIRHILVDEFQDTALTQYQLLEKLIIGWEPNDGRTLFVVGDPMQSIYRFREAEVGLFIRMRKNGIGHVKLLPLTLAMNFRSSQKIVEWNNQHFQAIFPSFNDMASGAVTYSPSVATKSLADETAITIQGFANAEVTNQASHIVTIIKTTQAQFPQDKIAILVRSRGHLAAIIPALKKANLPFRAIDIDPLASRQTIQDLLSLTSALLNPMDRIAWLAILRAPWCGLSLDDLYLIANDQPDAAIMMQLEKAEIIAKLSADAKTRLARILPILKASLLARERQPLRYWVENTWLKLGGPAVLQDESAFDEVNAYFQLLTESEQHNQTLDLEKLKSMLSQLFAPGKHEHEQLQIMTIHSAKGLEFDTVILPHLERKQPSDDRALLLWSQLPLRNDRAALLLAPVNAIGNDKDAIYEFISHQHRIKADYEMDRLLYVATTRAKKRLHLLFNIHQDEEQKYRVESNSFLKKLWPLINNQPSTNIESAITIHPSDATVTEPRPISRLTINWLNPMMDAENSDIYAHKKQTGFQWHEASPRLIGTVIHDVLQIISERSISWWQIQSVIKQKKYLSQRLLQQGILQSQLTDAIDIAYSAITNTLNDERGRWILSSHNQAKSEFAITALIDDKLETLIIDRTFIDENNIRWIIDYKTSTFSSLSLNVFLVQEQEKYRVQMQKYQTALQLIDEREVRLGLYFPVIPAWREW